MSSSITPVRIGTTAICAEEDHWDDGLRYDISPLPCVMAGSYAFVWGGGEWSLGTGALRHRYNPGTDTWALMSDAGAPALIEGSRGAWTGHELVVWGPMRLPDGTYVMDGGRYDPVAHHWSPMSQEGAPSLRQGRAPAHP